MVEGELVNVYGVDAGADDEVAIGGDHVEDGFGGGNDGAEGFDLQAIYDAGARGLDIKAAYALGKREAALAELDGIIL